MLEPWGLWQQPHLLLILSCTIKGASVSLSPATYRLYLYLYFTIERWRSRVCVCLLGTGPSFICRIRALVRWCKPAFAGVEVHPSVSVVLHLILLNLAHSEVLGLRVGKIETRHKGRRKHSHVLGQLDRCQVGRVAPLIDTQVKVELLSKGLSKTIASACAMVFPYSSFFSSWLFMSLSMPMPAVTAKRPM